MGGELGDDPVGVVAEEGDDLGDEARGAPVILQHLQLLELLVHQTLHRNHNRPNFFLKKNSLNPSARRRGEAGLTEANMEERRALSCSLSAAAAMAAFPRSGEVGAHRGSVGSRRSSGLRGGRRVGELNPIRGGDSDRGNLYIYKPARR